MTEVALKLQRPYLHSPPFAARSRPSWLAVIREEVPRKSLEVATSYKSWTPDSVESCHGPGPRTRDARQELGTALKTKPERPRERTRPD